MLKDINYYRYLHKERQDIPSYYRNMSLHIALENADIKEDWENFSKLFALAPEYLQKHLNMTGVIFDYNYTKLSNTEKNKLFNITRIVN